MRCPKCKKVEMSVVGRTDDNVALTCNYCHQSMVVKDEGIQEKEVEYKEKRLEKKEAKRKKAKDEVKI